MRQTAAHTFMLISDARADALREAMDPLVEIGSRVDLVPDVFAAMARLSLGERFDRVLLDVRSLDSPEMAFGQLVPRYFPEAQVDIPWLTGTSQALVRLGRPDLQTLEMAVLIESVSTAQVILAESTASLPLIESRLPLSTDGVIETDPAQPSLHDAVRHRMSSGSDAVPARRPPSRVPPGSPVEPRNTVDSQLTPEELDALLDETDGNGGPQL
mgnify:CR=1 FL=1